MSDPRLAVLQMNSGADPAANLAQASRLLEEAARAQARLAVLPENFASMGGPDAQRAIAETPDDGPLQAFLSTTARRLGLWIVGGSLPLTGPEPDRLRSACLVFDDNGQKRARYDKIHLFDVQVPRDGRAYRESDTFAPGNETVVVDTPIGRLGLSICYDLRFPELFRRLVEQGATVLAVPAAFTHITGEAHWELLLRARAVENLCSVLAAGQCGQHPQQRTTWGHSAIVGPWGRIEALLADSPAIAVATLKSDEQQRLRADFPCLQHRRPWLSCGPFGVVLCHPGDYPASTHHGDTQIP